LQAQLITKAAQDELDSLLKSGVRSPFMKKCGLSGAVAGQKRHCGKSNRPDEFDTKGAMPRRGFATKLDIRRRLLLAEKER